MEFREKNLIQDFLKVNDLIQPIRENTVFKGRLYQVKNLNEVQKVGLVEGIPSFTQETMKMVTIQNLDTKQTFTIAETFLFEHFKTEEEENQKKEFLN
jgi:hypothetical protein